jgi:hypothetical protein
VEIKLYNFRETVYTLHTPALGALESRAVGGRCVLSGAAAALQSISAAKLK